jgi:2-polyprenyl-6-methoxyphenol hydroxylase-like FAD-dependent oxidoreductase
MLHRGRRPGRHDAGHLFARAGIDVIVLEKWKDFFRDFRGDTIHPSTIEVLRALGLLDKFLRWNRTARRRSAGGSAAQT